MAHGSAARRRPRVLVLPGLLASDASTMVIRRFLRLLGYQVRGWRAAMPRAHGEGYRRWPCKTGGDDAPNLAHHLKPDARLPLRPAHRPGLGLFPGVEATDICDPIA